jgi:hypothetical protein
MTGLRSLVQTPLLPAEADIQYCAMYWVPAPAGTSGQALCQDTWPW